MIGSPLFPHAVASRFGVAVMAVGLLLPIHAAAESRGQSQAVRDARVEAQLVSRQTALTPGQRQTIGVRLDMDEHWHTYWQNPGDFGLATTVEWDLPDGFEASPIHWPAPDYILTSGLASYGFEGQMVLPVTLTVPEQLQRDSVTLKAQVEWMVCREACVPGEASLSLTLPVVSSASGSEVDPRWEDLFARAEDRQPREVDGPVEVHADAEQFRIGLGGEALGVDPTEVTTARFFPLAGDLIRPAAEQALRRGEGELWLTLQRSPRLKEVPDRLRGVLVIEHDGATRYLKIDHPISTD